MDPASTLPDAGTQAAMANGGMPVPTRKGRTVVVAGLATEKDARSFTVDRVIP
jgi:hypothetical protein